MEKNKDQLPKEGVELLAASSNAFIAKLAPPPPAKSGAASIGSLGSKFRGQLRDLMATIRATSPHYVRCLKPNDQNLPDKLTRLRLRDQLSYGGVLEAVRVARAGYPVRREHFDFLMRYRAINMNAVTKMLPEGMKGGIGMAAQRTEQEKAACKAAVVSLLDEADVENKDTQVQMGLTKVFLRKGAFEWLERNRAAMHKRYATTISKEIRGFRARREYKTYIGAVHCLQAAGRGMVARLEARKRRRRKAAVVLQSAARGRAEWRRYSGGRKAVLLLQSRLRGARDRKVVRDKR
jgi:myosin-5